MLCTELRSYGGKARQEEKDKITILTDNKTNDLVLSCLRKKGASANVTSLLRLLAFRLVSTTYRVYRNAK